MKSFMKRALAGVAMAASLLLVPSAMAQTNAATPAPVAVSTEGQGPALWVIRDNDSTIYLFGTFHLLRKNTPWGQAHVDSAFASADEVWLELTDADDTTQLVTLIRQLGISHDRPLSSVISAADWAALDGAVRNLGLNTAAFENMRPWWAAMNLTLVQLGKGGFDPAAGVEKVLTARAEALGKPLKGFESLAEQFGIFAGMSEAGQVELLRATLKEINSTPEQLDGLVTAWSTGDVDTLAGFLIDEMKQTQPEAYEKLIIRRNANWADQIEQMLRGDGTAFIAVGAAHLVGDDSVQAMLAKRGIHTERVWQ